MNTSQASCLLLNQHHFVGGPVGGGLKLGDPKHSQISRVVVSFQDPESAESPAVSERPGLVFLKIVLLQIIGDLHLK